MRFRPRVKLSDVNNPNATPVIFNFGGLDIVHFKKGHVHVHPDLIKLTPGQKPVKSIVMKKGKVEVIFLKDHLQKYKAGQLYRVAPGFARNFLLSTRTAVYSTYENRARFLNMSSTIGVPSSDYDALENINSNPYRIPVPPSPTLSERRKTKYDYEVEELKQKYAKIRSESTAKLA